MKLKRRYNFASANIDCEEVDKGAEEGGGNDEAPTVAPSAWSFSNVDDEEEEEEEIDDAVVDTILMLVT